VEKGLFSVIVNGQSVGTKEYGSSFGELALMYDSPRAASIRADTSAELWKLDRSTFRFILAKSSSKNSQDNVNTLRKVRTFDGLTGY